MVPTADKLFNFSFLKALRDVDGALSVVPRRITQLPISIVSEGIDAILREHQRVACAAASLQDLAATLKFRSYLDGR